MLSIFTFFRLHEHSNDPERVEILMKDKYSLDRLTE